MIKTLFSPKTWLKLYLILRLDQNFIITSLYGKLYHINKQAAFLCSVIVASTPEFHKHYMPDEKTTNTNISELSIPGRFSFLDHKITSRCGAANLHCQPGLSLAMWMKHDLPEVNRYTSKFLTEGMLLKVTSLFSYCIGNEYLQDCKR